MHQSKHVSDAGGSRYFAVGYRVLRESTSEEYVDCLVRSGIAREIVRLPPTARHYYEVAMD